jgi:UDP-N-acetyl-D-glucosamine/UDP-N-acetyl-D-galactosamine dehydrogenase
MMVYENNDYKIALIGLGYVGLPLALAFSEKFKVTGYDISHKRIHDLQNGIDVTNETTAKDIENTTCLFSNKLSDISSANVYIIGVPTPIDSEFRPNLKPLIDASSSIGSIIKKNDLVIFESTVYPGTTEEICIPVIENASKLIFNKDFFVGYSPERINPGDKVNTLKNIPKVVSGSNNKTKNIVAWLYSEILESEIHAAPNIRTAEMSKIIENTQRDMNIAVMNEFSRICSTLKINIYDVLEAAKTKWNFLPFMPGLVGGHCIGVDPYYLIEKSTTSGYLPELLSRGRQLNEAMPDYIFDVILFKANKISLPIKNSKVLILGYTFKPDCPDIRNTKIEYIANNFIKWGANVSINDPWVTESDQKQIEKKINIVFNNEEEDYDIVVHAVAHSEFTRYSLNKIKDKFGARLVFDLHNTIIDAETIYN